MNSQSKKIALFGTSADPPTYGHQALLEGLSNLFPKVATWASDIPMKSHGLPLFQRHKLLSELVKAINNPNLSIVQELSSPWTINTLKVASKKWPNEELVFVIGSDLIAEVGNWMDSEKILQEARIAIVPRIGWPIKEKELTILKSLQGKIEFLPLSIPKSSSTHIRSNLNIYDIPCSILPAIMQKI